MTDNGTGNHIESVSPAAGDESGGKPRRKKYSAGASVVPAKLPFAFQAAAIAFWAPLAGIALWLISLLLNATFQRTGDVKLQRDIAFYLFGMEVILMVLGLATGIIALLSIRKHGKKGLLKRPLIGVAVAVISLSYVGYVLNEVRSIPGRLMAQLESKLAGDWEVEARADNVPVTIRLSLRSDHTSAWKVNGPKPLELAGRWEIEPRERSLMLRVTLEGPQNQKVKVEGFLREIAEDQITLSNVTNDGRVVNQVFKRAK